MEFTFFIIAAILYFVFKDVFGSGDAARQGQKYRAKQAQEKANIAPINAAEMQDPDYLSKRQQQDPHEQAMSELDSDSIDRAIWAKAYALSANEEATKRLYVKLRAEQLQVTRPLREISGTESHDSQPFTIFSVKGLSYIVAVVPPGGLFGAWLVNNSHDLPTNFMDVASGQLWLSFVLWPFAVGYLVWKRNQ